MDDFDAAARQVVGGDAFDAAATDVTNDQRSALRSSLYSGLMENPDAAAKAQNLGKRVGLPRDLVQRNMPEIERNARLDDFDAVLQDTPTLARWLSEQDNAAIAHDNVENMGAIERTIRNLGPASLSGLLGASSGVVGVVQAPFDLAAPLLDPLTGTILPENPLRRVASGLSGYRQSIEATSKGWMPQADGTVERGIYSGVGSFARNMAALPLALAPGGQGAALTAMTAPVAGQEFGQARDAGIAPIPAATYGMSQAAIEYATEKIPVSRLIGDLSANTGLGKLLVRQMAAEIPGEQLATVLQDLNEWAILKPEATFTDYLKDRPGAAAETLIATIVGVGGQTTLMKGLDAAINRSERQAQKAQQAEQVAQEMARMGEMIKADKVLQRNPEAFEQFIAKATEDGPVPVVYIDANTLMQSGVAEQVASVSASVAEQIEDAVASGGQIAIPVEEFAARIAPTDFAQSLMEHIRTEPDGFTMAEAQEYMQSQNEQLQSEVERTLTEQQADATFQTSQETVKASIQQELDAIGRFTPEKNEADATLFASYYAVRAAQLGVTPEQFYEQRKVRFAAQSIAGQQFDQTAIETPEFQNWFGDSKVVDSAGKPLVVYHGTDQDVASFDPAKLGLATGAQSAAQGFFFVARPDVAVSYANYAALDAPVRREIAQSEKAEKRGDWDGYDAALQRAEELEAEMADAPQRGQNVVPVYLSLRNPAVMDAGGELFTTIQSEINAFLKKAKRAGHDGAIIKNLDDDPRFSDRVGDHYIAFKPEQIKSATGNRGTFDPNDPNILHQQARGAFSPESFTITLLKGADLSTALHEGAHFFFENDIALASELVAQNQGFGADTMTEGERQIVADVSALMNFHGITGTVQEQLAQWYQMDFEQKRAAHERTAESFERYLFEGQAPSLELAPYFQKFRAWMISVYKSLKDFITRNPEAGKIDDTVRQVFDRMLATSEQIQLSEQGRSMFPLFANAEEAGMTVDEFAAYQAQSIQPTADAIQELQAKGMRDMQWLRNARGRELKKLQKQSKALRAEARIEARREVMSQPVYRAWQFLTGKLTSEEKAAVKDDAPKSGKTINPETDSLFQAIAKLGGLDRMAVQKAWGWSETERTPQPGFGQPLLRRENGLGIDAMAERLQEYGYLARDADYMTEFEAKFDAEYRGDTQYSTEYDYARSMGDRRAGDGADLDRLNAGRIELVALKNMDFLPSMVEIIQDLGMTGKDGLHPDIVADLFGFTSGDELIRTLAIAEKPAEAIEALTDRLMLERNGELATPEAIEQAADAAIHNAARARMVATEYNTLAQATGQPRILTDAARAFARNVVARVKVRHLKPSQYSNAAARAGQNAMRAQKAGDMGTAAAEKRNQLVQTLAAREAHNAREEIDRGADYLRKFEKAGVRKSLDFGYLDQIDQLLERFDLKKSTSLKNIDRRISLAKWIQSQRDAGMEPEISEQLENEAFSTSYKEISVEEFRGLVDAVEQIEHLGRLKRKLLTARDERDFRERADEAVQTIVENGGEARPLDLESDRGIKPWVEGMQAGHRKLSSLFRQMDGGRDDGVIWNLLGRSMNERSTQEAVANEKATMALTEIFKPVLALKGGLNGDKRFIPEIENSLTRGGRLAVALNWGNQQNRQRIMDGDKWSDAQVKAILRTLSPVEADFVNKVWEYIDTFWPEVAAKEKRMLGKEPEKVLAEPFDMVLADGSVARMRGGYYPLKYDAARDDRAEKHDAAEIAADMKRGAFTRATTRRGHTKGRLEEVKRPVRKSLDVITQHVTQVTHDLAWHEWLVDANRVIDDHKINQAIRDYYGPAVVRTIKDNIAAIATADVVPQTKMDQALLYLRSNISRSTMGWSLTTAFLQPFGLTQSMVRIGPKYVLRGLARWGGDVARFQNGTAWIYERSDFMRLRDKTFNRELQEINGRINKGRSNARQIYDASLFMFMQKMQKIADVPTWYGAYEKAMEQGADEAKAVAMADQAVLDSQGGGQTKDLAELQRKHPMLSMFYSYFNVTYNLAAESTAKTDFKNPQAVAGWLSDMALLMIIPALGPALILELLRGGGDEDDPEEWAKMLAEWQAGYLLGTVLGLRELSGAVAGFDYTGPPVGRVVGDIGKAGTQLAQGEADEAMGLSVVRLFGSALGIPTVQIIRSWRGWNAWSEGEAPATAVLLGPPPP